MLLNLYLVKRENDNLGMNKTMYKTNIRKIQIFLIIQDAKLLLLPCQILFLNFADTMIQSVVVVVIGSLDLY